MTNINRPKSKSRTFLLSVNFSGKDYPSPLSPRPAAGYSGKVRDKFDKLIIGVFAVMLIAMAVLRIMQYVADHKKVLIAIGGKTIVAEVAETPLRQTQGLSGRKSLGSDAGMFFVFKQPSVLTFWMHGMRFPLDFIWIRGDEIRDISPHVPADYPGFLHPREEVDKVLEVNEGVIERYGVKIGDKVGID